MINGIDVSTFQGAINWEKVKKYNDVNFAMIRGGYGRFQIDERFIQNYNNCKRVGMPVGVYHYTYASTVKKAEQEAEFCLSYLKGKKFEYPIAFDIEDNTLYDLSKAKLTSIVKTFCSIVEKAGYYVVIYANKEWLTKKLDMNKLSQYDVWLAQWSSKPSYDGQFGLWQYSDKGYICGINGRVDLDKAYKDYPNIIKKAGLNGWKEIENVNDEKIIKPGKLLNLHNTSIYVSSTSRSPVNTVTGTYYVYDGIKVNNRIRISPLKTWCLKKPESSYVTGWIKI